MATATIKLIGSEIVAPADDDAIPVWDESGAVMGWAKKSSLMGGTLTGGGTVATGTFTLTVPATGTAVLLSGAQTIDGAKTFSGANTFQAGISLKEAISGELVAVSNDAVEALATWTSKTAGRLIVNDLSNGYTADFQLRGGFNTTDEIDDVSSKFSDTKDTASSINVYYDTDGYYVQNKSGGSANISVIAFSA